LAATPICSIQIKADKPLDRDLPLETDKSLGAALKRRRLALKWTQQEAAEYLRILFQNYRKFEANIHIPHDHKKNRVNEFLGYSFWDDDSDSLSNRLFNYRIQMSFTAVELGKHIGVSRNTIKRIELGIPVSQPMTKKIENYLTIK